MLLGSSLKRPISLDLFTQIVHIDRSKDILLVICLMFSIQLIMWVVLEM